MKTINIWRVSLHLSLFLGFQAVAQSSLTNGLVAYYPFNGDANDASGFGPNGLVNGAVLIPDHNGITNSAYFFSGAQNITFAAPPLTNVDNWTVAAWLNPSSLSQNSAAVAVGYDNGISGGNGYELSVAGGVYAFGQNVSCTLGGVDWVDSGYSFTATNVWHHVAMMRSNSVIQFYVDGVRTANTNTETPLVPTAFSIGSVSGQRFFQGGIDEVRIYNRPLSASEINALAASFPQILQQPVSATNTVGHTQIFTVTASSSSVSYQWQKNGANLSDGGQILGTATSALTLANLTTNVAGFFDVIVSNAVGSVTSANALLVVITNAPTNTLTLGLVGYYPFNGDASDASGYGNNGVNHGAVLVADHNGIANSAYFFSGAQNITFTNVPLTNVDNWTVAAWLSPSVINQYGAAVSVGFDDGSASGNGYQLGISAAPYTAGPDIFCVLGGVTWVDSGYAFSATNVWHHVAIVRTNGVVQFYVDGTLKSNTSTATPIQPTAFYIGSVTGQRYFKGAIDEVCLYNRALSSNEVALFLTSGPQIANPPQIVQQPANAIAAPGSTQIFTVAATPVSVTYQWQKNGVNLSNGAQLTGAATSALTLSALALGDSGSYDVVVSNSYGIVTSSNAVLVVRNLTLTDGLVAYYPFNGDATDASGFGNNGVNHGAVLVPDHFGNPNSAYFFNGAQNITFTNVPMTNVDNWTITAWLKSSILNQYGAAVSVGFDDGSASGNGYQLGISTAPYTAGRNVFCVLGGVTWVDSGYAFSATNVWHHVAIVRTNGVVQFYVDGARTANTSTATPIKPTAFYIGSVTAQRYFNGAIDEVRLYNRVLSTNEINLLALTLPQIIQQPANAGASVHGACVFTAAASPPLGLTYQWQKNGINLVDGAQIIGSTTTNLTLLNIALTDAGSYALVATNSYGSATSSNAVLVVSSGPITDGLVAYYPFNGNANDASGFGNNPTTNTATLVPDRNGNPNSAYFFNGGQNIIFASVPLTNVDNWTVAAWLNTSTLTQNGEAVVIGSDNGSTGNGYELGLSGGSNTAGRNATGVVGGVNWVDSGYSFPATNEWHHVTMIRSNGVIQFYADGVRTLNTSTKVPSTPTAFSIGSVTGQRFFRGSIDEVRIYNRVLSANDVALISDGPPYIVQSPSNLVVCPATACIFTAVAGSHFPVYQWQKNGVNLSNGGQISGAGTTALTLSSVSPNDAGSYSVLVTNSYGSVLSPSGTLIVSSRPARITPTVVNGFVVGGTIIDGGCGYTQVPTLTFIGTNQTPPGGYVQITNGSVAGLVMTNPGFACSAAMQILVQPPIYSTMTYTHSITNVPGAAATPQVVNGYIVGATVTASGTGYQTPPPVSFNDATGFGAAAIAQINSLGAVTNISITHPGFGYTANASITIAALPLSDVIIPGAADVMVGQSYQLQDTLTLTNWSPVGTTFTATNTVWSATNFWPLQNATNLFFRLYQLP